ncbi:hypothetical protein SAMN05216360_110213 [Methylobacterium phyllostachyos]|uniref:Uncharacterized protein n=1 Tax=Methylobacterium phyllostachyos TaxID=582672 RepID=A0A1H0DLD1_9HYPH|nr:hypothetical protein [Methylobacterium phyllostachyos]SDN70965.1 hypothetical protein SAMN05216360_110213 [Methylobacterium phyllostachyos]
MRSFSRILTLIGFFVLAFTGPSIAQQSYGWSRMPDGRMVPFVPHALPGEAHGIAKAPPAGSPSKQIFESVTNEAILRGLSIAFVILASCTVILFVLGCGSRVVVFADASDVLMSASMFIAPVVTALATIGLVLLFTPDRPDAHGGFRELVQQNPAPAFAIVVGALWWLWAILGTLISSIRHNGLIVGTLVAVMKVGAVFSLLAVWYGMILNEANTLEGEKARFFLFLILAWFASRFVNGHRVTERREMLMRPARLTAAQA